MRKIFLSNADIWMKCAAHPKLVSEVDTSIYDFEKDDTLRLEGIAIHETARNIMQAGEFPTVGTMVAGVKLTQEMLDCVVEYVKVLDSYGNDWKIEQKLDADAIAPNVRAIPDAYLIDPVARHLVIVDLKTGYKPVEVYPNWQLLGYMLAILGSTQVDDEYSVEFVIVQPRAYHKDGTVRIYRAESVYSLMHRAMELSTGAKAAMVDSPVATVGAHCTNCAARHECQTLRMSALRVVELAAQGEIDNLPDAAVDKELLLLEDARKLIDSRITGMQAKAMHILRNGKTLPHWQMKQGQGRKAWRDEAAAIAMGDLMGKNLRKPESAITPTQAEKLLDKSLIETYSYRAPGETKLVRVDDGAVGKIF